MLQMWREDDDQSKWLKHKVEEFQYPPKIKLDVFYDKKKAMSEIIKFTLHFGGILETVYSKSCDKTIHFRGISDWFIDDNNHLSKQLQLM